MLDHTESQSPRDQLRSQRLSERPTRPPAEIPGYETRSFLGSGAYGEVWVGVDQNTGRRVAIKYLTHAGGLDWSHLSREVEKLVFLSADRYVVQLLDVGWEAVPPYFVMEYMEHGSLEELLGRRGPLPVAEAELLFREVVIGILHAHRKGILHCDLKPANVLLDADGQPRLADFGQSRLSHEQRPSLGTLFYMAPEQADMHAVPDAAWDVYALGAVFYRMLTGSPPYRNDGALTDIDSTMTLEARLNRYRQLIETSPRPSQHRQVNGIDRGLVDIIDRCLAPNPAQRFPDAQSILDALEQRRDAAQRRPLLMLGLIGPLILLSIMALFGWHGYRRAVSQQDRVIASNAEKRNQLAAQFAAEVVARELDRYFRSVESAANDPRLQQKMYACLEHEEIKGILARLHQPLPGNERQMLIDKFNHHSARGELEAYLAEFLNDSTRPFAASWFANEPRGIHLASQYTTPPSNSPVGYNYSWRSYFHGGPDDLPEQELPLDIEPIRDIHLSSVFRSTATTTWKVAVSKRVFYNDRSLGIIALTIELGRLTDEFARNQLEQFAVLVDGRLGENKGRILQHPLFDELFEEHAELPETLDEYRVDLEKLARGAPGHYRDPLGQESHGKKYDRNWVAAQAAVRLDDRRGTDQDGRGYDTGLVVVVQEDYDAAAAPVHTLARWLERLGLFALLATFLALIGIWLFVVRILRDSVSQSMTTAAGHRSADVHELETMEMPKKSRSPGT